MKEGWPRVAKKTGHKIYVSNIKVNSFPATLLNATRLQSSFRLAPLSILLARLALKQVLKQHKRPYDEAS